MRNTSLGSLPAGRQGPIKIKLKRLKKTDLTEQSGDLLKNA
jgi:hypothetical protein